MAADLNKDLALLKEHIEELKDGDNHHQTVVEYRMQEEIEEIKALGDRCSPLIKETRGCKDRDWPAAQKGVVECIGDCNVALNKVRSFDKQLSDILPKLNLEKEQALLRKRFSCKLTQRDV